MMMRRFALVSGLAVFSAVAFASQASAQVVAAPVDIDFAGNIIGVCSFSGTTGGTLVKPGNNQLVEATKGVDIGSMGATGESGKTTVNCTSGGQVSVGAPVKVAAPAGFTDSSRQAVIYDPAGSTTTPSRSSATVGTVVWTGLPTASITIPANTPRALNVAMVAGTQGTTGGIPSGTYSYKVTVTATPN